MDWPDERYVRLYTRDTTTWKLWSWQARFVFMSLLRKVDRSGVLDLGDDGLEGLAAVIEVPLEIVEVGLPLLTKKDKHGRSTVEMLDGTIGIPNFIVAQEAKSSDAKRSRDYRERTRSRRGSEEPSQNVTGTNGSRDEPSRGVTEPSRPITERHTASHGVTLNHAVLNHTDPPQTPPGGAVVVEVKEDQEGNPLEPEEAPEVRKIYAKEKYRLAYEAGISRGKGGVRYAMPREQEGHLGQVIEAFAVETRTGDPLVGEVLIEWIGDHAEWFAKWLLSQPENVAGYYSAFGPKGLLKRLNEVKGRAA